MENNKETPGWILLTLLIIGFGIGYWVSSENHTPSDEEIDTIATQRECISGLLDKMDSARNDLIYNVEGTYSEQQEAMENSIYVLNDDLVGCSE